MFTVKILNYSGVQSEQDGACMVTDGGVELTSVYLREWGSVEVWYPASQNFKDCIEELKKETHDGYHSDLESPEMSAEEFNMLMSLHDTYKAVCTFTDKNGDDASYLIAENEEVYITDRHGNTVHSIKQQDKQL